MKAIGLSPLTGRGKRGDAKRLVLQAKRLFRATISFEDTRESSEAWLDMRIAPKGQTWWSLNKPLQDTLWDGWVELGEEFYEAITAAPGPGGLPAFKGTEAITLGAGPVRLGHVHGAQRAAEGPSPDRAVRGPTRADGWGVRPSSRLPGQGHNRAAEDPGCVPPTPG